MFSADIRRRSRKAQPQISQMNADVRRRGSGAPTWQGYPHLDLTRRVIGCFYETYNELGGGFLESMYRIALELVFAERGISASRESLLPVAFRGHVIGQFRADFVVEGALVVEVKAVPRLEDAHLAQLLNYLRVSGLEIGLLLNYGPRPVVRRLIRSAGRR